MADNVTADAGTGGATFAADDIGGVHFPRTKIVIGADGTNDGDVSSANPLPVNGTITANLGATDNAVLDAIQAAVETIDNSISGSETQVDVVAALPTGANLVGDVGLSGARTSGGTSSFRSIDLDETEEAVKATAGQIYWIHATNTGTTPRFLKIYNDTVANVMVGTTTPIHTFLIPSQGDANGAGFNLAIPNGMAFDTAITVAATTGVADSDTGAPGANEVVVNMGFA